MTWESVRLPLPVARSEGEAKGKRSRSFPCRQGIVRSYSGPDVPCHSNLILPASPLINTTQRCDMFSASQATRLAALKTRGQLRRRFVGLNGARQVARERGEVLRPDRVDGDETSSSHPCRVRPETGEKRHCCVWCVPTEYHNND